MKRHRHLIALAATATIATVAPALAQDITVSLPAAAPVYPGATIVEQSTEADGDIDVTLRTSASVDSVRQFYDRAMRDAGLTVTTKARDPNDVKLRARNSAQKFEVEIERHGNTTEIDIEIDRLP